jgi:hypothetical protein
VIFLTGCILTSFGCSFALGHSARKLEKANIPAGSTWIFAGGAFIWAVLLTLLAVVIR